ncbi:MULTISPECIES: thioesterase II family protein [Bacillus]|uniref:Thioesterase domain-containing protein n=2 Tax=Bacillus cereus group TaxID=86661 RepID=A0A9W5KWX9_BACCE|nr:MULTISPECIES: thioesterase domain-containing protein [Bacillus cereus group]EEM49205.1 Oleoyl-(Acyl-carrier-protein) hydrolase [Bacillus thuringiensis serovar pakistani str. T13001]EJR71543.1 hypothetical protein IK5_03009 [Bacillus cereus VD154]KIU74691.1 oleoyl-(acyl-carrier-protein) hydrolase [Bacillus thuringiensis Sbt003]MDZ4652099.1 alpha/beta fold hydrolase [Bacillus cereus]MEB2588743.1 alpha/beta fold hydrolase [Bacillus cereus]
MGGYFEFLRKKDDAEFTLFCFPHAGGTSELYKNWDEIINENCNVCILTLPGRGRMALEKPFQDISKVLEQLSRDIESLLEKPFIFFGHSMGALISYELAKLLQKNFKKQPDHIYVSSYPAPHLLNENLIKDEINDAELIIKLKELNGTPKEILSHKRFIKMLLPIIRADFAVLNSYNFKEGVILDCPITAIIGTNDNLNIEQAKEWFKHTTNMFTLKIYHGDHFYLNDLSIQNELGQLIEKDFAKL